MATAVWMEPAGKEQDDFQKKRDSILPHLDRQAETEKRL
jgi:hypothetical protein